MSYIPTRGDFRIRKTARGFRVACRVGSGWEWLSDYWATRSHALDYIDQAIIRAQRETD